MLNSFLTMIILLTASLGLSSAFLLFDNCPVPSPCTCSGSSGNFIKINCYGKVLTDIPHIKQSNTRVNMLFLYFNGNNLTVIPDNAFRNFSSINATKIDLELNANNIHMIKSSAFNGIENATNTLSLQGNNLTAIPFAIINLLHLKILDIRGNSLHSLDTLVMSNIGKSLISFSIDLNNFTQWPKEIHFLQVLRSLTLNHIRFSHLDINAFNGFHNTLEHLTLDYSNLEKVPYAICHLGHLVSLNFRYSNNLRENESSILEPCSSTLSTVTSLDLASNNIHIFPDVFTVFPSLTSLGLQSNKLQYIESVKIPNTTKLISINLRYNLFDRIPYALNRLKSLTTIYLTGNDIKTIDTPDLTGLAALTCLYIDRNPIMYMSSDVFENNLYLHYIKLDKTNLGHVPVAVTSLTKLHTLSLNGMQIECTCDMSYLKDWNVSAVTNFNTKCASFSETIKHFIMNYLQSCP